ncbi:hypothetical protein M514_05701, partial [Trichuris suis]
LKVRCSRKEFFFSLFARSSEGETTRALLTILRRIGKMELQTTKCCRRERASGGLRRNKKKKKKNRGGGSSVAEFTAVVQVVYFFKTEASLFCRFKNSPTVATPRKRVQYCP